MAAAIPRRSLIASAFISRREDSANLSKDICLTIYTFTFYFNNSENMENIGKMRLV
jgi:hypothetical protein